MQTHRRDRSSSQPRVIPLRSPLMWLPREHRSTRSLIWSAALLWMLVFILTDTLETRVAATSARDVPAIGGVVHTTAPTPAVIED